MTATPNSQRVLLGALVVLLAAIGVVLLTRHSQGPRAAAHSGSAFAGPTFPPGVRAPDFSLSDVSGRRVTLSSYRGRVVVLTFLHSKCVIACPLMAEGIKGALDKLPGSGRGVQAIGISVDPAEDTVAGRRKFLAEHQMTGRLAYVTGPLASLKAVWSGYHIQPVQKGLPDHSDFVLLIDRAGVIRVGFPAGQLTPEHLAHDIAVLQRERA